VAYCTSSVAFEDGRRPQFEIAYDIAVVAVGEAPATFGVPGVAEHCYFMKEVSDCVGLRKRIQEAFELAALPGEGGRGMVQHCRVRGGGVWYRREVEGGGGGGRWQGAWALWVCPERGDV
jgi:NADH:ubiquinone reductase (non-electrogenic)